MGGFYGGGSGGGSGTSFPIATAGGTPDAITATFTPALTLTDKVICAVVASGANTVTNPTFAPDGLVAHTITKNGGSALVVGDIPAALAVIILEYNAANTRWELVDVQGDTLVTEGALINSATSKATPVDADMIGLMDSAASNILKKLSWANLKATLKTYFDTLYSGITTATVNTTDATQTTLQTIAIAVGGVTIRTTINYKKTGGAGTGTIGDAGSFILTQSFKNVGGTVTSTGSLQNDYTSTAIGSEAVTLDISGTNVRVRVTGIVNDDITWNGSTITTIV